MGVEEWESRKEKKKKDLTGRRNKNNIGSSLIVQFPFVWVLPEKKTELPACA